MWFYGKKNPLDEWECKQTGHIVKLVTDNSNIECEKEYDFTTKIKTNDNTVTMFVKRDN